MSKRAQEERQASIVQAAERLVQAKAELDDAKDRMKLAREEYRNSVDGVMQAESGEYETLYNQDGETNG